MEQTAVEWLAIRYHQRQGYLSLEDIAKAKQMEKEQIIDAATWGALAENGEKYYKEKYKNENNK